jgi:hypothetical protein
VFTLQLVGAREDSNNKPSKTIEHNRARLFTTGEYY